MHFHIPYQIGTVPGERGFLYLDGHTNPIGHALITGTLGIREVEKRLRDVLGEIAQEIEEGVKRGAKIE